MSTLDPQPVAPRPSAGDLQSVVRKLGIPVAQRHIFLCADATNPKCCDRERSLAAWDFLKARLKELGLSEAGGIQRTKANCLRLCADGPIAVVYPEATWYTYVDQADIDEIVESHLKNGRVVERLLTPPHVGR